MAGGGTGGHLFPALAIADELRALRPDAEIRFVGASGKLEARLVPAHGYDFRGIWISGFHRGMKMSNLLFPLKVIVSIMQSFFFIRSFRPDLAVGTGGYASGPILWVASLFGVPILIHESNSYPGVTTRLLAQRATTIFTAFSETARWLRNADRIQCTGTPLRKNLGSVTREEGRRHFGLQGAQRIVLILGGSQGARSINGAVLRVAHRFADEGISLIWQTGAGHYESIKKQAPGSMKGWVGAFIDKIEYAYAAADLVVCRAGASTMAEITALGKAAILVPLPHSAANHQLMNARVLEQHGAAVVVEELELETSLFDQIRHLLEDKEKQTRMESASKRLGKWDAGRIIAQQILQQL